MIYHFFIDQTLNGLWIGNICLTTSSFIAVQNWLEKGLLLYILDF